ncbi:mechanosensitive ion channel family protein, partial [Sphingobacterium shayense]|uniref:mechanosensitive ion channel family protein n=1 Tax=Sphingobacterium shayense TaxID=626343 RepID=UPI003CCD8230|nr:mechanosensitive ion channel family protein [Sphingobacterium shayense]
MEKIQMGIEHFIDTLILKVPTLILAAVILFLGIYLIRFTRALVDRRFEKRNIDPSIRSFVSTLIKFTLYILLILTVANTLGIQTTSFIAA